jgi:hypothetical protein
MKIPAAFFLMVLLFSCGSEKPPPAGTDPEAAAPQPAVPREAVLTRGNGWVTGIPGFGSNAFPALSGEYSLGAAVFSVYASREPIFFSDTWQRRPGTGTAAVFQRLVGNTFLAAAVLEAGPDPWTVVFEFPGGIADTGLEDAAFNRLIGAWSSRFLYFVSLVKTPGDVSLPAAVGF